MTDYIIFYLTVFISAFIGRAIYEKIKGDK